MAWKTRMKKLTPTQLRYMQDEINKAQAAHKKELQEVTAHKEQIIKALREQIKKEHVNTAWEYEGYNKADSLGSVLDQTNVVHAQGTPIPTGRKDDDGKLRFDLIPPEALNYLAAGLTTGAHDYDARNWENGFEWNRAYAALQRHLNAWQALERFDVKTGLPHLALAMCELSFLCAFENRGHNRFQDDRSQHTYNNMSELQARVKLYINLQKSATTEPRP